MIRGALTQEGKVVCEISVPRLFAEARQLWLRPIPSRCCAGSFHFLFVYVWQGVGAVEILVWLPFQVYLGQTGFPYGLNGLQYAPLRSGEWILPGLWELGQGVLIKLRWYLSGAMQNRDSFLSISRILGHLVWLCLQEFLFLPVEQLSPRSDDLVSNTVVVKWFVIYSFLIKSGERVWKLGKETWILCTLGPVFTCCIFSCSIHCVSCL